MKKLQLAAALLPLPLMAEELPAPEFDEHGAVLCSYAITLMMQKYAAECTENTTATAWLSDLLDEHRKFVTHNAQWTAQVLSNFESDQLPEALQASFCAAPTPKEMFEGVLNSEAEFRAEVEQSLSVDRKPVWNPCL